MLDGTPVTQTDGHPAWKGPGIDLFDLRINLETHLVGQVHQTWIGYLSAGKLLRTGVAVCRGYRHTVFYVGLTQKCL